MTKMPRYARWVNEQQCHWLGHESGSYRMCKIWEKIQFILSPMIKIACVTAKKLVCPSKASNPLSKHVDSSAWHYNREANDKKILDSIELLVGYNVCELRDEKIICVDAMVLPILHLKDWDDSSALAIAFYWMLKDENCCQFLTIPLPFQCSLWFHMHTNKGFVHLNTVFGT